MLKKTVKVGICGAGSIVQTHCQTFARLDEAEVVAVSSRSGTTARNTALEFGIGKNFDDHRRLIEDPEVELVLVTCPNYQHHELAMYAISCGKHVMVEKPLAMNSLQCKELIQAAKDAGVLLLYAENLPFAPKFKKLRELATDGAFGKIYMLRQIERHAGPHSPWFFQKETASGGALMDLGCHSISVVLDIMQDAKIRQVSAISKTYTHTHGDVEDFIIVNLEFDNDALGVIESNWCHLGGMDSITEVFGKGGNGYADLMKGSGLETYIDNDFNIRGHNSRGWNRPAFDALYEFGYIQQMQAMTDCILRGAAPLQSGEDGLRVMKIMEAAYESAAKRIPVKL